MHLSKCCFALVVLLFVGGALANAGVKQTSGYIVKTPKKDATLKGSDAFYIASSSKIFHVYHLLKNHFAPTSDGPRTFPVYLYSTAAVTSDLTGNLVVDNKNGNYGYELELTGGWTNGVPHTITNIFLAMDLVDRDPLAGIRSLAKQFQTSASLSSWTGKLVFEHPFSDADSEIDTPALVINDNLFDIRVFPDKSVTVVPDVTGIFTIDVSQLVNCNSAGCNSVAVNVDYSSWVISVTGQIYSSGGNVNFTWPIYNPRDPSYTENTAELFFSKVFIKELRALGVTVNEQNEDQGTERNLVATLASKTINEVIKPYLYMSLEPLGNFLGLITKGKYSAAVEDYNSYYWARYPTRWINFSTLVGTGNQVYLDNTIKFFQEIATDTPVFMPLFNALPIMGEIGTLSAQNFDSPVALHDIIHAKSGNNILATGRDFKKFGLPLYSDFALAGWTMTSSGYLPFITVINGFKVPALQFDAVGNPTNLLDIVAVVADVQAKQTRELAQIYGFNGNKASTSTGSSNSIGNLVGGDNLDDTSSASAAAAAKNTGMIIGIVVAVVVVVVVAVVIGVAIWYRKYRQTQ